MRIYLAVEVERQEGKDMSRLLVEEQLASEVGEVSFEVEDSQYEVSEVEVLESPADTKKKSLSEDALADALGALGYFWADKHPIRINDDDPPDEWDEMDTLIFSLVARSREMKPNPTRVRTIIERTKVATALRRENA